MCRGHLHACTCTHWRTPGCCGALLAGNRYNLVSKPCLPTSTLIPPEALRGSRRGSPARSQWGQPRPGGAVPFSVARPGERVGRPLGKVPTAVPGHSMGYTVGTSLTGPLLIPWGPAGRRWGWLRHRGHCSEPASRLDTGRPRLQGRGQGEGTARRGRQAGQGGPGGAPHHAPRRHLSPWDMLGIRFPDCHRQSHRTGPRVASAEAEWVCLRRRG